MSAAWQEAQFLDAPAFESLSEAEHKLIYADANKWEYDWSTKRWYNVYHPANDEWVVMRQAAEARGML